MKIKQVSKAVIAIACLGGMVACTSTPIIGPGSTADPVPPRIITDKDGNHTWDRPSAFGPVPPELQAKGDAICRGVGSEKATGYHPGALQENGKPFSGGGYFCVGSSK